MGLRVSELECRVWGSEFRVKVKDRFGCVEGSGGVDPHNGESNGHEWGTWTPGLCSSAFGFRNVSKSGSHVIVPVLSPHSPPKQKKRMAFSKQAPPEVLGHNPYTTLIPPLEFRVLGLGAALFSIVVPVSPQTLNLGSSSGFCSGHSHRRRHSQGS